MEKYQKNRDIKADSLLQTILAVARIVLVLLGIVGIAMQFFREDGWLNQAFSKMLNSELGMWWLPIIAVALYLLNKWMNSVETGKATKRGNLPLNAMMLIGLYFLYRLVSDGTI